MRQYIMAGSTKQTGVHARHPTSPSSFEIDSSSYAVTNTTTQSSSTCASFSRFARFLDSPSAWFSEAVGGPLGQLQRRRILARPAGPLGGARET